MIVCVFELAYLILIVVGRIPIAYLQPSQPTFNWHYIPIATEYCWSYLCYCLSLTIIHHHQHSLTNTNHWWIPSNWPSFTINWPPFTYEVANSIWPTCFGFSLGLGGFCVMSKAVTMGASLARLASPMAGKSPMAMGGGWWWMMANDRVDDGKVDGDHGQHWLIHGGLSCWLIDPITIFNIQW